MQRSNEARISASPSPRYAVCGGLRGFSCAAPVAPYNHQAAFPSGGGLFFCWKPLDSFQTGEQE
jgi:hypothetical protein